METSDNSVHALLPRDAVLTFSIKKSQKSQIEKLENRTQSSEVLFDEKLCKRFLKQYAEKKSCSRENRSRIILENFK